MKTLMLLLTIIMIIAGIISSVKGDWDIGSYFISFACLDLLIANSISK